MVILLIVNSAVLGLPVAVWLAKYSFTVLLLTRIDYLTFHARKEGTT